MPGAADKIIINSGDFNADAKAMKAAFKSGIYLTQEIRALDKLKAAQPFVAKQEAICEALDRAMAKAIKAQRELNDEIRKWIDDELGLNTP